MKKQLQILTMMINFLIAAILILAAAAALYLYLTWPTLPETDSGIFIYNIPPGATVVLVEDTANER